MSFNKIVATYLAVLVFALILGTISCVPTIGPKGDAGSPGKGTNGSSCSLIQVPAGTSIHCTDGTDAFIPTPQNGHDGSNGQDGHNGVDGVDATPVTVVQLCPGVTTYPSVFVEVALCISNKLYAVYSAKNGFLVYLPPGVYHSDAIGSACNLTVHENCQVSN